MLIWLIPIVPELPQPTLHLLHSIDVSASVSRCTRISLSDRSAGWSGLQARRKQGLLFSESGGVCFIMARDGMCMLTCVVFLCMWACCFLGCVDRTRRIRPVCRVFPAFICTHPPLLLCTSFPSVGLGKISSNLTSLHAGGLPQRMWDDRAGVCSLWGIFNPVDSLRQHLWS